MTKHAAPLIVFLLCACGPAAVVEDELSFRDALATDGGTVTLTADFDISEPLEISFDGVVDGAGFMITGAGTAFLVSVARVSVHDVVLSGFDTVAVLAEAANQTRFENVVLDSSTATTFASAPIAVSDIFIEGCRVYAPVLAQPMVTISGQRWHVDHNIFPTAFEDVARTTSILTTEAGGNASIEGNSLGGGVIDTSVGTGRNAVFGNTEVGGVVAHETDVVAGNS